MMNYWMKIFNLLAILSIFSLAICQQDSSESLYHFCNSTILDGQGVLLSPNFPQPYNNYAYCQWRITVERDRTIKLTFKSFEIESSGNCAYDRVSVYNGPTDSHPLLGKFCGAIRPSDVVTTSNRMLMTFRSDDSTQKSGFLAVFISVAPQLASQNSCGGLMTNNAGSFHSVNFPKSNYPNSLTCVWHIRTARDREIVLRFGKMTLETSANCKYDSVSVFSGWSTRDETHSLGRYCKIENVPTEIVSIGNELFVSFAADSSGNDIGFSATYSTRMMSLPATTSATAVPGKPYLTESPVSLVCPETTVLTADHGAIVSPGYKATGGYAANLRCSWLIVTTPGTRVVLRFENFQLERDANCMFDYVSTYSGRIDSEESQLGRYCGTVANLEVRSDNNEMFVLFVTDSGGNAAGFRASYSAETNRQTRATTTTSQSTTTVITTTSPPLTTTNILTNATIAPSSGCSGSCSSPANLPAAICSYNFVAAIKVVKIKTLKSGTARARVSLFRIFRLNIRDVSLKKKAKIWLDISCPACFLTLQKRKKYIVAGNDLTSTGGELSFSDYVGKFSKKSQKIVKKATRRCRRSGSNKKRKRHVKKQ